MIGALFAAALIAQPCVVRSGGPGAGAVLSPDVALETADPVELAIVGAGVAAAGPQTELRCAPDAVELRRGRLWVGADEPLTVRVRERPLLLSAGASVVIGVEPGEPPTVAVAEGWVEVPGAGRVGPGRIWTGGEVRAGGAGWFAALGPGAAPWSWTREQVRAELLRRLTALSAQGLGPAGAPGRAGDEMTGDPELFGADGGPAGRLLEAGLRPDPFRAP